MRVRSCGIFAVALLACAEARSDEAGERFASIFVARCVEPTLAGDPPRIEGLAQDSILTEFFPQSYDIGPGAILARPWGDEGGETAADLGCRLHLMKAPGRPGNVNVEAVILEVQAALRALVDSGRLSVALERETGEVRLAYYREEAEDLSSDILVTAHAYEDSVIVAASPRALPETVLIGPWLGLTLP